MSFGVNLDSSMDSMEETRFKKKHSDLIQKLAKKLHFTYTELECIFIIYYKLQKDNADKNQNGISKNQLRDVLHSGLDMTDDGLMDRIFSVFERGPSTCVSMETWATALSLWLRGTLEEKIDYCFSVYDLLGDGLIGRETMFYFLRTSLISQSSEDDAEESVKDMIEVITKKMDVDRDGKISYNDYKTTVLHQPMMLEALGQCLPTREAVHTFITTFTPRIGKM
ncbi:calaxin [Tribolium castaneum]|uniref:EF-hand calcium-binding domain-containing protein 1-like Protein n=1 Tax=Tribolium castaneum TaxID=7070 RepID=A0A139WAS3_TRICA|nr:PREDICTED: EF-hand calcium-binding domain-containing protein 1-like [Tribolium castaneum]KYB25036.1 EF-hand calcium-binding domain-containing protein 1-like Protein [Tribolium castaneum]|eukprot:XP_008199884.1 PREDICTED: EF-hand calcium-binding domain-containing protein 1-like [Tribolium castaneum]